MTMQVPESVSREMAEWNAATADAIEIEGYSLYGGKENDNKLDSLVGVPFVIRTITFREGDIIPPGQKQPRDYVSCEILIRPDHAHKFNRKYVVFNDGSTGIYRQVVAALAVRGEVELDENLPETGDANTTRYDVSFSGGEDLPAEYNISLLCPEGLRKSEYKSPAGDSTTWYLA